MPMRAITRVVRGGASAIVAGALVAGIGAVSASAGAAEGAEPTAVRLKVGTQDADRVRTQASRPRGLLEQSGVEVFRNDWVQVIRDGRAVRSDDRRVLRDGDLVKVVRIRHAVRTHRARVHHGTRTRAVTSLPPGRRKVARPGRDGVRKIRASVVLRNERIVHREVHRHWVRRPHPRVVLVGKRRPTVPGTAHLNWRALARCESGGNPRAVNPSGYYGLYQFDVSTWRGVGGSGMPNHASRAEQTYRAKRLFAARGRSPWPNCGRFL